jgi:ATP-dependent helicase/nuclease subunit A
MTVHGSKGLEFPWVFVPHLGRVPREPNRELFVDAVDGEMRLWLAPPEDPTSRSAAKLASTWATIAAPVLGAERLAIEAEERRLMYVALTRARERLFLAVPPGSQPEGQMPSWAAVLEPALGLDLDGQSDVGVIAGTKVAVRISRIWDETPQAPSLGDSMAGVTAQAPVVAPALDLERVGLGVAAGGIADYKYCPYRYFLGRELGLPAHIGIGTADTAGDAAERGTLVHRALEYVDFATGEVPEAILDSAGPLRDFVTSAVQRVCASAVGALAQSLPPERVHREMPFRLRLEHGTTISGVVDLALEKDEGVVIVEYKSGRKSPGTSELHATQTRIYATALEKALGKPALGITVAYVGQDAEHWTHLRDRRLAMNEAMLADYADRIAAGEFEARPDRDRCQACPFGGARRACVHRFEGS